MTPADLDAFAAVMKARGVFKFRTGDVEIEMSNAGLIEHAAPKTAPYPPPMREADGPSPQDKRHPAEEQEDPMLYAATEGLPG